MTPADGVTTIERRTRDERPVRRPFETRTLPVAAEVASWVVVVGVALALVVTPVPFVALAWLVVAGAAMVVLRADQSRRPRDRGVQVYDDVARLDTRGLGAGVPSSQLFVPYGLVLGWCTRRGLVSGWFRQQSVAELDDVAAGRLSGPQLYAHWQGVFASDMLDDEGAAFARRYLWGVEPHGALQVDRIAAGRPFGRNAWPHPRRDQQWFLRDLEQLAGPGRSAYLLPDTPETAAAFDRAADARLARWRRWRLVYALYESERVAVRRRFARYYAFPD
jgi:hypothetical protein